MNTRTAVSARTAEKLATELFERFAVDNPPVPVEKIADHLGARIVREPLDGTISGLLLRANNATLIAVNSDHHPRRQRFTIAHELGHLQMHDGEYIVDSTVRVNRRDQLSSMATDREEIAANAFAAALLMPELLVRTAISHLRESQVANPSRAAEVLAEQFAVSTEAMGYRLINLGLST